MTANFLCLGECPARSPRPGLSTTRTCARMSSGAASAEWDTEARCCGRPTRAGVAQPTPAPATVPEQGLVLFGIWDEGPGPVLCASPGPRPAAPHHTPPHPTTPLGPATTTGPGLTGVHPSRSEVAGSKPGPSRVRGELRPGLVQPRRRIGWSRGSKAPGR